VHGEFDFDNDSALGYSCFKVQFSILAISKDLQVQSSLPKKTWFSSSLGTISFILTLGLWLLVPGVAATGDNQAAGPPVGAMTDRDPSAYQGMTADQIARVKKGEIVILDQPQSFEGRQLVAAAFMFNQDLNTLWTLMLQGWRQEEYMPRLERSPLIKKWDNGHLIEFQLKVAGIGVKFRLLGAFEPSRYYCSWKLDPGFPNDMKEVSGFWQFYWVDEHHTLARYGSYTETTIWVPALIRDYLTRRDLPESLNVQKRWVDSGGTYRKPGYQPAPGPKEAR
jgi:hypothetical protein